MKNNKGRKAMNSRFIHAFKLLEEEGEIIRNDHQKGFSAVAENMLGNRQYGHLINKFLSGERCITFEQAERFCELYQVQEDYIFKGVQPIFNHQEYDEEGYPAPSSENTEDGKENNIKYQKNVAAHASSALDLKIREGEKSFSIPGLKGGDYIAFSISGNSMYPTLTDEDMVICRELEGVERIVENEIYAIVSDNGVQVKRIQKVFSPRKKIIRLKMISDNYLEHDPFFVEVSTVRKILKVDRKITSI